VRADQTLIAPPDALRPYSVTLWAFQNFDTLQVVKLLFTVAASADIHTSTLTRRGIAQRARGKSRTREYRFAPHQPPVRSVVRHELIEVERIGNTLPLHVFGTEYLNIERRPLYDVVNRSAVTVTASMTGAGFARLRVAAKRDQRRVPATIQADAESCFSLVALALRPSPSPLNIGQNDLLPVQKPVPIPKSIWRSLMFGVIAWRKEIRSNRMTR